MKRKIFGILLAVVLALGVSLVTAVPVSAAVSVTSATGGEAISADTAADATTPAWTDLGAITIAEQIDGDIAVSQAGVTLILNVPSGFEFNSAQTPSINAIAGDITALTLTSITVSAITVTFSTDAVADGGLDSIVIGQTTVIQVRPTSGTPLVSGNILRDAGSTSSITGVDGTTNFGTLTEVHGAASKFVIINPTDGTVDAAITVTVQLQDQFGNIVTTGPNKDDDVTLTVDGSATVPGAGLVNIANGVGTIDVSDQVAETVNLGLNDSQGTGFDVSSTQDVVFAHGLANKFVIINPTDGTVDAAITVTVQLQDQFGNIVTTGPNKDDDVTLTVSGSATVPGAGLVDIVNGVGTIAVSDTVAETVNLGLLDSQATGFDVSSTQDVIFAPGALASFTISGTPASVLASTPFPSPVNDITVTAYDAWGNTKTDYVGTVTWSSTSVATLPADYTFVGLDAGIHTFPGSQFILSTAGTQTITVTDTITLVSATSSGIAVLAWGGGAAPPDITPAIISDISASNITETSADISWRTNERSTSQVEYWSSPSMLSPLDETMVYNHHVHLTDLTPGTAYHYKTMSKDRAGNLAVSDEDTFTTLGEVPAAVFSASDLSISPSEINIGETVTISVLVANTGNASGDYEVTLKINDVVEATKKVTVAAGASEEVTFTRAKDVAGSYSVDVNRLSGSFTVKKPAPPPPPPPPPAPPAPEAINWWLIGGIIAAVVVAGSVTFILVRRRPR